MASPQRIFNIYRQLKQDAESVYDFQVASGERISGTVQLLRSANAERVLQRWGEEMQELVGVLDGSHDDPYIMEATQSWYWACCYAAIQGASWEDIAFASLGQEAAQARIQDVDQLRTQVERLCARDPDQVPARKCFLLWCIADQLYRAQTPPEEQRSIEEMMEVDLYEMRKRPYLAPILAAVPE